MRGTDLLGAALVSGALAVAGCGDTSDDSPSETAAAKDSANISSAAGVAAGNRTPDQATPKVIGPRSVSVGEEITLKGSGFPPGAKLAFVADPTKLHDLQGVGIIVKSHPRVSDRGRFKATFLFPSHYCTAAPACVRKPFTPGMPVDLVVAPTGNTLKLSISE